MFLDTVEDTLVNLTSGFAQGWNQSLGYQSMNGYQYDPYSGQYYTIPAQRSPIYQPIPYYPPAYNQGADWLPLLLIGGVLLFALMKD
ncbi:hypothetical protein [Vampirovibrio chlorellavorus]|uniref:hypothetical protein n=1 Tax=Vampirovibrio chlorellavorus TaxID=758823 RepID=UPI0026F22D97|nr:hypothetical protein [Vampirovibrio chlorellavorus]